MLVGWVAGGTYVHYYYSVSSPAVYRIRIREFVSLPAKGGGLPLQGTPEGTFPFPSLAGEVLQVIKPGLHCGEAEGEGGTKSACTGSSVGKYFFLAQCRLQFLQPTAWAASSQAASD